MAAISAAVPAVVLFPNSSGMGGMEAHLMQLARGLRERGIQVAAICEPRPDTQLLRDGLRGAGAEVHELGARAAAGGVRRRIAALVDVMKRYPGCVVHMHYGGYGGGELVQLAACLSGVKAVVRTEHVPPVPPITRTGRLLVHVRDRFLARVICVSEQNRQEHLAALRRDGQQLMVVHNGVDLERFSPRISGIGVAAEFGFPPDAPIVGTIGRLVERRKGLNYFIDMAAQVHAQRPATRFLLVGDGDLRPELEAQAAAQDLGPDVLVFTGPRVDVPRLYAAMSVFVMPSLYEGCQYALLEAMAMARPVVSTAAGVAPIVVRDGETGVMVPFAHAAALAGGVLQLLADPARAAVLGHVGRQEIVERFSLDAMVDELVGVYRAALTSA
jgi:glycosyltransferase involved in cell wall biosynthesis